MARSVPLSWLLLVLGCEPSLSTPPSKAEPPPIRLEVYPPAPLDEIASVTHLRLVGGASADGVALVSGEVGPRHLDQIADGELSKALTERLVPVGVWAEGDDLVVAPRTALAPGERFDLVVASREIVFPLMVSPAALAPLPRLFPPAGATSGSAEAVYCGEAALAAIDESAALLPRGPVGRFVTSSPGGGAAGCLRFTSAEGGRAGEWIPPPVVAASLPLDPTPIHVAQEPGSGPTAIACEAGDATFGPGCARVEDDRIVVKSPEAPVLWVVSAETVDSVFVTESGAEVTVFGLPPDQEVQLRVETLDLQGVWTDGRVTVRTLPARPRFVLNEIYANPIGPEPQQEWVEIVNDGSAAGDLGACRFEDIGGEVALPAAWLGPGGFAVVANVGFDLAGEYDEAPAPSATLLLVEKLGKNGLSNSGEPMKLVCGDGASSRTPAEPKPKPGMSLARATPGAPDSDPTSFALTAPTPGAANRFTREEGD